MKRPRQYKIRYFDRFRVQRELFAADLDESFFREWYDKLSTDPENNWHQGSSTCIHLLVRHKNAPDWLRDIYANHPRYDRRSVAFVEGSTKYKYKNIDKILSDRSNTTRLHFFHSVLYDLKNGFELQPEHLNKVLKIPSSLPSLRTMLKQAIQEEFLALISPDPTIRTLSKIFYNATLQQKQLLLDSLK